VQRRRVVTHKSVINATLSELWKRVVVS